MNLIDQIVFPLFILWFVALILVMFRKDLDLHWKISFVFCFAFYVVLFGKEWSSALERLEKNPIFEIREWIYGIPKVIFYMLFFLWPYTLLRIFYSSSEIYNKQIAYLLVTVTIVYWFLFWLYFQFKEPIDSFLENEFIIYFQ